MTTTIQAYLTEVESMSLRSVAGAGDQVEVSVRTRGGGEVALRLVARKGRTIRVTDLRRRDKRTASKNVIPIGDMVPAGRIR